MVGNLTTDLVLHGLTSLPDWGYEVPAKVPGLEMEKYTPRVLYPQEKYRELVEKLRTERRAWLAKFGGLDPAIPKAIER